jgi:hypothetical protein
VELAIKLWEISEKWEADHMVDRVRGVCEACFEVHKGDCSAFARAVAGELGVPLHGLANEIVQTLRTGQGWTSLPGGVAAAKRAHNGKLVMAGLVGSEQRPPHLNGHVVVVVDGPSDDDGYPRAYWGQLGRTGAEDTSIRSAWKRADRDRVSYAEHDI